MSSDPSLVNHINPETLHAPFGYTHVVQTFGGWTAYISGQVPLDAGGNLVGPGDLRAQTHQVFRNLGAALDAVGGSFANVVKLTYYLVDMGQIQTVREVRAEYLNTEKPPASTAVEARALFRPDVMIEVEAIAVL
ncbi:MAG: RidA family protein [Anaerolineae bacterium]|nr:RidA family protein [Anaerolineae bacterium]